jgi:hypothetical protein
VPLRYTVVSATATFGHWQSIRAVLHKKPSLCMQDEVLVDPHRIPSTAFAQFCSRSMSSTLLSLQPYGRSTLCVARTSDVSRKCHRDQQNTQKHVPLCRKEKVQARSYQMRSAVFAQFCSRSMSLISCSIPGAQQRAPCLLRGHPKKIVLYCGKVEIQVDPHQILRRLCPILFPQHVNKWFSFGK